VNLPKLTTQPSSTIVELGKYAIFTCSATGYNVKYQWTIGSGSFPNKVTDVNTNTLVIPDVRSSDDNIYTCTISNEGGSATSDPAKLTVTGETPCYVTTVHEMVEIFGNAGLPEVIVDPPSQSVVITKPVQFTTTVSGVGKESFSYQWKHNGKDIYGKTSTILNIDSVTENHGGSYECVVKNEYGDCVSSYPAKLHISKYTKYLLVH